MLNQLLENYILKQPTTYFEEKKLFTPGKGTCMFNIYGLPVKYKSSVSGVIENWVILLCVWSAQQKRLLMNSTTETIVNE